MVLPSGINLCILAYFQFGDLVIPGFEAINVNRSSW